ncbi:hypothetical protein D9M68_713480 [compost metagenome]
MNMLEHLEPGPANHERNQAEKEFDFDDILANHLIRDVRRSTGGVIKLIADIYVAIAEHSLPWNEYVIEKRDRIHFLVSSTQRMIPGAHPVVDGIAANEL